MPRARGIKLNQTGPLPKKERKIESLTLLADKWRYVKRDARIKIEELKYGRNFPIFGGATVVRSFVDGSCGRSMKYEKLAGCT